VGGFVLVVIDSGSSDGTREAADAAGARVECIDQREFNHGGTRNRAIALTSGERVCLLTQDARPMTKSYVANLVRPFDDESIDGVYARQFPRGDCDPLLAERLRRWSATRDEPEQKSLVKGDALKSLAAFEALPPLERYLSSVFDNVASAVRRSTWKQLHFPERTFGEDVAWGRLVLRAGGTLAFEPTAEVEHSHRIKMFREFKRIYCDHRNLFELFELRNVPDWSSVRNGARGQWRVYRELLDGVQVGPLERLFWKAYSLPYAYLETAAQFLGARSHWKTKESTFWRWADRKIRAGV
jgi:rhamnosyltransferase